MAGAKNKVIAGDHDGRPVMNIGQTLSILLGFNKGIPLTSETVEAYEVITDEHKRSAASGVVRGLVGNVLLGPVGMLAGAMTAKDIGIYQVAVQFKDGKKSLLDIDEKYYKALIKGCF